MSWNLPVAEGGQEYGLKAKGTRSCGVWMKAVRICSRVILVTFTVYVCSVNVHSCLNCVTFVMVDCSCDALLCSTAATKGFTMNMQYIVAYARAYAPLWSCT